MLNQQEKAALKSANLSVDGFFVKYVQKFLDKKLSADKYKALEEFFLENNPNRKDIEDLKRRLDRRSIPEFATKLAAHTQKETFLILLFKAEMEQLGHTVVIKDYGVDNEGGFIGHATRECAKSDFLVSVNGGSFKPCEVKNSPSATKCTFKVSNLNAYIKQGSYMVLFYGTGRLENNFSNMNVKTTRWAILTPDDIAKLLTLPKMKYREVGFKNGVQITDKNFSEFFKSRRLKSL